MKVISTYHNTTTGEEFRVMSLPSDYLPITHCVESRYDGKVIAVHEFNELLQAKLYAFNQATGSMLELVA